MMNIKAKLLIFSALAVLSLAAVQSVKAESFLNVNPPQNQPEGVAVTSPADNIPFFYFTLTNMENSDEDINLNRLVINNIGTSGDQARSAFSSLSLCASRGGYFNGAGGCGNELVGRTSTRSGRNGYVFTNFNYSIPEGETRYFTVLATVNVSIRDGLTIKLALNNANSFRAIGAETRSRTQITGNLPIQGNEFTIDAERGINGLGAISAQDESNPISTNVVAGSANVPVLNIRFRATDHSFRITNLRFQILNGTNSSIESLTISYRNQAGQTLTATRNLAAGANSFSYGLGLNNAVYVPANGSAIVNVYVNLAVINGEHGAVTGDEISFGFLTNQGFSARNDNNRLIRSVVEANEGINWIAGNVMVLHGTVPTIEAVADNGNLANGSADLYRFRVTAAEGTDLSLKKLSFSLGMRDTVRNAATLTLRNFQILEGSSYNNVQALTQADTGADSYQVYNANNGNIGTTTISNGRTGAGKLSNVNGLIYGNALGQGDQANNNVVLVFNDDRMIRAGESKYYILRAIAENVDTGANSNDSVSMYLFDEDTEIDSNNVLEASCDLRGVHGSGVKYCLSSDGNNEDSATAIIWSDNTGTNGNNTHQDVNADNRYDGTQVNGSADWFNGWKIKTLSVQRTLN